MGILKCKSCGGILEKDGNIYICTKCGEASKNNDNIVDIRNISDLPDYLLCDVIFTHIKTNAIKLEKELARQNLFEAIEFLRHSDIYINWPKTFKHSIPKIEALEIANMFSDTGLIVEIVPTKASE